MIKKIYIFIVLFFIGLSTQANAYECYFDKLKPGATKKDLEKIDIFAHGPGDPDILTKQITAEERQLFSIVLIFFSKALTMIFSA